MPQTRDASVPFRIPRGIRGSMAATFNSAIAAGVEAALPPLIAGGVINSQTARSATGQRRGRRRRRSGGGEGEWGESCARKMAARGGILRKSSGGIYYRGCWHKWRTVCADAFGEKGEASERAIRHRGARGEGEEGEEEEEGQAEGGKSRGGRSGIKNSGRK